MGPAFVAAIAYVDPGNVAANLTAGARYGYLLVWVLVAANLMAMLVQYLSAKLGLVTGRSLPELLGERMPTRARLAFWAQAEIVAIATDLAEVFGGALALRILFGLPYLAGGAIIGLVSMLLLGVQSGNGQRRFELVIMGLLMVITIGFMGGLFVTDVSWPQAAAGLVPRFAGIETVLLATSMLGATVMPHAIYVHSALARDRHGHQAGRLARLLNATGLDVATSMVIAGSVNLGMLLLAASALFGSSGTDSILGAHAAITAALGSAVSTLFAVALLASGLASTSVGSYAGANILSGLLHARLPIFWQRMVTLVPALAVLALGAQPTWALVMSQVVLSMGIPFALIPLVRLTSNPQVMGARTNSPAMRLIAWTVVGLIVALNAALIVLAAAGVG